MVVFPVCFFTANSAQTPVTSDWSSPAIRGVVKRSVDPTVGIYLDDVYQPNLAFDMGFVDLERLEVFTGSSGYTIWSKYIGRCHPVGHQKADG